VNDIDVQELYSDSIDKSIVISLKQILQDSILDIIEYCGQHREIRSTSTQTTVSTPSKVAHTAAMTTSSFRSLTDVHLNFISNYPDIIKVCYYYYICYLWKYI
jgi:hypothetical protein